MRSLRVGQRFQRRQSRVPLSESMVSLTGAVRDRTLRPACRGGGALPVWQSGPPSERYRQYKQPIDLWPSAAALSPANDQHLVGSLDWRVDRGWPLRHHILRGLADIRSVKDAQSRQFRWFGCSSGTGVRGFIAGTSEDRKHNR